MQARNITDNKKVVSKGFVTKERLIDDYCYRRWGLVPKLQEVPSYPQVA